MYLSDRVAENLRFLIREVQLQVSRTRTFIEGHSKNVRDAIRGRDDYIDNLREFVQRASFERASEPGSLAIPIAANTIATNLERIADFCVDIVGQIEHIDEDECPTLDELEPFFKEVENALGKVEQAVEHRNVQVALEICHAEPRLDELYSAAFNNRIGVLGRPERVHSTITTLFIEHYFERMGDSLMNIGEAIISAALGEKVKIGQLWALQDSLQDVDPDRVVTDVNLHAPGESRSGCRIATVRDSSAKNPALVFKEGARRKLLEERRAIRVWEERVPGISPSVNSFHENGDRAAMLLEFLQGDTLEKILLQRGVSELESAVEQICKTMRYIWASTYSATCAPSDFITQLEQRLPEVLRIHPSFDRGGVGVGEQRFASLGELLDKLKGVQAKVGFEGSVLTHGDFNLDNIIPDPSREYSRLIDMHRSRTGDYLQDVSVFLVSNFRLQALEEPVRRRIEYVILRFLDLANYQANEWGDRYMQARLSLGVVRSLITSTRFVLDEQFASSLFLRGLYLANRLVNSRELESFEIPKAVFFD